MGISVLPRKLRNGLLVGVLVAGMAAVAIRYRPERADRTVPSEPLAWAERLELRLFDALARRQSREFPAHPDITVVTLDAESIARTRGTMGPWPWSRETLGKVVEELDALGARLVVLDRVDADADPSPGADARFAAQLERARDVVLGFDFGGQPSEQRVTGGRWAVLEGRYATREAALLAAGPLLTRRATPYLVRNGERVELWLGGHPDKAAALLEASRLAGERGAPEPSLRELSIEETLDRVTPEALFHERCAVDVRGAEGLHLRLVSQALRQPLPNLLATPASFGAVDPEPDLDGDVRSVRHLVKYEGRYYPSLALAAALRLAGTTEVAFSGPRLMVGGAGVPLDSNGFAVLRQVGAVDEADPYPRIGVDEVVKSLARRELDRSPDRHLLERVKDKIVFVVDETAPARSRAAMAQALALDNLLRGQGLLRASLDDDMAAVFILVLLGAMLSMVTRTARLRRTVLVELLLTVAVGGAFLVFVERCARAGLWVGAAIPLLGFVGALALATLVNVLDERKTTELVREALGRSVGSSLIERILRNPQHFGLEGEQRVMSVYHADVNGFSEIARQLKPKELVRLLNEYFTEITAQVAATQGVLDRFSGDGVMAFWGAPLPNHRNALDACRCALQIRGALSRERASWKQRFGVELTTRAGLNTGDMVVGDMGAKGRGQRLNYSVLGDAVGFAARLEALNKVFGTEILIGEGTWEAAREGIEARELDLVRAPGRVRPVRVFELLALAGDLPKTRRPALELFEKARVLYREREFKQALTLFERLQAEFPADRATAVYLERCAHYVLHPPAEEWDGVFEKQA